MATTTKFFMAGHALIACKNNYLVTRRSKLSAYKPFKWDIPGGIVEPGETLEEAISREVIEETGLEIQVGNVIYVYANRDQVPVRQTFQAVYLCKYKSGVVRLNPLEHDVHKWLHYDDIASLDMIDFLRELVKFYHPANI
ncbi:NUDIX hydrolase [Candidatus Bathyarchaeota archaeon]|nr:NUDIX hydrolase [Candidatus Bathyarchaeota archaeon]